MELRVRGLAVQTGRLPFDSLDVERDLDTSLEHTHRAAMCGYPHVALLGVLLVGAPHLLPACSEPSCNLAARNGVVVFVVDGTTGQDVCSATVTITDGA
jgi:hypothetical protein